uniref:Small ribosomal subunit protein uS3c n=1 Tax=Haptophyceae sp. NIES-3900 TaxID=2748608 RepID=A0A7R6WDX8_9EUKA|nr:ribosomal protein S3 [Haptophyceae sp. NIES-3900]
MGQKIHPLGIRIGTTQTHRSNWFANTKNYSDILREDFIIRSFVEKKLRNSGIVRIQINRKADQVELAIHTSRPGIVVGRSGTGIDLLRKGIETLINSSNKIKIYVVEVENPDTEAALIGDFIVQQLEKRVAFKRAVRQAVQKVQRAGIQGVKIQVAGRLNGAEIARSEWVREGRVPLQTLRADIDYAYRRAQTTYGILGIKIWMFKGEISSAKTKKY